MVTSKADIEAEIKRLEERLKIAQPSGVDALTASIGVWKKRLAEWEGKEPVVEKISVPEEPDKVEGPIIEKIEPTEKPKETKHKQPETMR